MSKDISNADVESYLASQPPIAQACRYQPGTQIGCWRVTALLGKGGSSEVYRVERVSDGFAAALKIELPDRVRRGDAPSSRLSAESAFLRENVAPAFPRLYDDGTHEDNRYYVMELLEPMALPTSDSAVAAYAIKVCLAVRLLHMKGFVHRDIKPLNILARADGTPVLVDLGLLRELPTSETQTGDTVTIVDGKVVGSGTPRYAAPEQFNGGRLSAATDIHGIGMLINECFRNDPPRIWERIVSRATSSIPERRFREVTDLIAAIRGRHRRRTLTLIATTLVVTSAAVFGGALWWRTVGKELARWHSLCETVETPEGRETVVNLAARTNVFERTLRLKDGRYRIVGPGILEADIVGSSNVYVHLSRCVVQNMTRIPPPENAVRYYVDDGVYLNFAQLDYGPQFRGIFEMHDNSRSSVRHRGPRSLRELNAEKYERFRKYVEHEKREREKRRDDRRLKPTTYY